MYEYVITTQILPFVVSHVQVQLKRITALYSPNSADYAKNAQWSNLLTHCHMLISNNNETLMDVCRAYQQVFLWESSTYAC